jgi:hypothetical protein
MDGNVLIFIRDYQLKRQVINLVVKLGLSFIECNEMDELNFRMQLFTSDNKLFLYEFAEGLNEEKQFKKLEDMKTKGWKTLVIFSKYFIPYIDQSQKAGINDLIIHPIEIISVKNKLVTLLSVPIEVVEEPVNIENEDPIDEVIKQEINRAYRGNYSLSFVIFEFISVTKSKQKEFLKELKDKLRETDAIIHGHANNIYLILCPFTPKNFVVEVENKIRVLFDEKKNKAEIAPLSLLYVYGLTLGVDGEDFENLMTTLEKSLEDLKKVDQSIKQKMFYDPEKLRAYRNLYRM